MDNENENSYQNLNNLNLSPPPYTYISNLENFENFINNTDSNVSQSDSNHLNYRNSNHQALNFDSDLLIDQSNEQLLERMPFDRTTERNFDRSAHDRNQYQNLNLINNPLISIDMPPSYDSLVDRNVSAEPVKLKKQQPNY